MKHNFHILFAIAAIIFLISTLTWANKKNNTDEEDKESLRLFSKAFLATIIFSILWALT